MSCAFFRFFQEILNLLLLRPLILMSPNATASRRNSLRKKSISSRALYECENHGCYFDEGHFLQFKGTNNDKTKTQRPLRMCKFCAIKSFAISFSHSILHPISMLNLFEHLIQINSLEEKKCHKPKKKKIKPNERAKWTGKRSQ